MADINMLMGAEVKKSDFLADTIGLGLLSLIEMLTPVLVWFLYVSKRDGMTPFDAANNDWYYISWWSMWIGNLVAYTAPFLMWIPSYFSDTAAKIYGASWMWAAGLGGLNFIFVWTSLLVSGIEWPDWKDIWVTFVLYTIIQMVMGRAGMDAAKGAKIWYMWHAMQKKCERDAEGKCVWPEGEDPASMIDWDREDDDWDY